MSFPSPTDNPFDIFASWYGQAQNCGLQEPTAFTLATANKTGVPSSRILLLKGFDDSGFTFFTNYTSRKSQEIAENPRASLCFYWPPINKQIRINGTVEKTSTEESDAYFATRPRVSQLGAWASKQSQPLDNYTNLEERVKKHEEKFAGQDVPRPPYWGGFRLIPLTIEFWEQVEFRLHKRLKFTHSDSGWKGEYLFP